MSAGEVVDERNPAVVAGLALGAVAVLALLWFVVVSPLLSDGEEGAAPESPAAPTATEQPDAAEDVEEPPPADDVVELPVATYEVFLSRDPFEPVIPEPGDGDGEPVDGEPGDGEPGDGDGEPGDGEPGDGDPGDGDPDDGDGGPDDACTGKDEVVCDGHVVSLVDVFVDDDGTPTAVVQVDSQLYEVQKDDIFAENFQVLSVEPPCVTLLFGDDSFTLCEGERVMK